VKNTLKRSALISAVAAGLALAGASASAQQADWTKSKWGPNDEIGAANYLNPQLVLQAARLIKTGKVYELGQVVSSESPAYAPRTCSIYIVQPGQAQGTTLGPTKTTYNDDILNCWVGMGSQLDGLGHIGIDNVYYNGNHAKDFAQISGLTKLGVEKVPPMVTRGVLLDMAAYFGVDVVKEGTPFNQAEIDGAAKKQGVEIRQGDVVLFHTGWAAMAKQDPKKFVAVQPGLGVGGARYLTSKGVVAIGADTAALEVIPFEKDAGLFEVHQILLTQTGTYILEGMVTAALAKDKAYEFMFVLGHAKYKGAVQSMINPVAIR
jgi:kynurenine formamidase